MKSPKFSGRLKKLKQDLRILHILGENLRSLFRRTSSTAAFRCSVFIPNCTKMRKSYSGFLVRRVAGDSMLPVLDEGKIVLALRHIKKLKPEQIVVVRHDGVDKIKRVQKIAGQRVFVLGDNLAASTDSRSFGWLPIEAIMAKVIWPRLAKTLRPRYGGNAKHR